MCQSKLAEVDNTVLKNLRKKKLPKQTVVMNLHCRVATSTWSDFIVRYVNDWSCFLSCCVVNFTSGNQVVPVKGILNSCDRICVASPVTESAFFE